jgi:hypothetical protein
MKICKYCKKEFTPFRINVIYCCKKCREKDWIENNKDRDRELKKKSRLRHPKICKLCGCVIPIEDRRNGQVRCDACEPLVDKSNKERMRLWASNIRKEFIEYKESVGCSICGYNKFGGSLDYHHVDSDEKERRIDAKSWHAKNESYKKEIKKCILVCKNCHYEIHNMKE